MQSTELNYSELVYLFAESYVPEASLLQNKEELPSGKKVNVGKIGNLCAEVAFAYLYHKGYITLEFSTKKSLGIFSKKVVVSNRKLEGAGLTSLEKLIYDLSDGSDIATILYRLIGSECAIPWAVVTGVVKESLVNKEFLSKEEITKKIIVSFVTYKYHFNPSKVVNFNNEVQELNSKVKEFAQKDFYKDLVKAVDSGISSQREKPDDD